MYPNKLTISSTCHQFVLSQQDCRVGPCKKQEYHRCKYPEMYKIPNKYSNPNSNFKLVP